MQLCAKKCSIKNGNFSVNCDFVISRGEHLALFGPSGTGKASPPGPPGPCSGGGGPREIP